MKKLLVLLFICCCLTSSLFSATERLYQTISTYYRVYSNVSEIYTQEIADKMEACLSLFNSIFHFDLKKLDVKLRVVIYADQSGFDAYLNKLLGKTRSDFVYIHYTDLVKSELVGYKKEDSSTFNSLLVHQGLIQFLKAFAPTAPMWMQEGIAAYVESAVYNVNTKSFTLEKNLVWLDTLKKIILGAGPGTYMTIAELITLDKDSAISKISTFYPEVWGLVYFLLNSEKKIYNRLLSDSIRSLDPALSMVENSIKIKDEVFVWVKSDLLEKDFIAFIQSLKTFQDYIQDGIAQYAAKEYTKATTSFSAAKEIKPTDYFAFYYLGLIAYSSKDYYTAKQHYLTALTLGADAGLTNYALGVNSYADNEFDTAEVYLNEALKANSEQYREKVAEILNRIDAESFYADGEIYIEPPVTDGLSETSSTGGTLNTGISNTGTSTTGTSNTGTSNTGTSTTGTSTTGISTTGISNTGTSTTGISNTGTSTTGTLTTDTSTTGTLTTGTSTTGASITGTSTTGISTTGTSVTGTSTMSTSTTDTSSTPDVSNEGTLDSTTDVSISTPEVTASTANISDILDDAP